jgi:hypothetical protein
LQAYYALLCFLFRLVSPVATVFFDPASNCKKPFRVQILGFCAWLEVSLGVIWGTEVGLRLTLKISIQSQKSIQPIRPFLILKGVRKT